MAGITLAQAQAALTEALAARSKILQSQSYKIGDRSSQRAALEAVNADIQFWDAKVRELDPSGNVRRIGFAVPGDG